MCGGDAEVERVPVEGGFSESEDPEETNKGSNTASGLGERRLGGGGFNARLTSEAGTSAWSTSLRTLAAALHDTWLKIWLRRGAATERPTERVSLASSRGRGVTRVMIGGGLVRIVKMNKGLLLYRSWLELLMMTGTAQES